LSARALRAASRTARKLEPTWVYVDSIPTWATASDDEDDFNDADYIFEIGDTDVRDEDF
jgi:hypothetical protein